MEHNGQFDSPNGVVLSATIVLIVYELFGFCYTDFACLSLTNARK